MSTFEHFLAASVRARGKRVRVTFDPRHRRRVFLQADLEKVLTEAGFATDIVSSGEEALTLLMDGTKRPSALVTDIKLAGRLTGWEVAKRIREKTPLSRSSM
jgi:DNA-binding response OmpR family regulator